MTNHLQPRCVTCKTPLLWSFDERQWVHNDGKHYRSAADGWYHEARPAGRWPKRADDVLKIAERIGVIYEQQGAKA